MFEIRMFSVKLWLNSCPRNLIFLTELLANKLKTYKFENCQIFAVNILEFSLNKENLKIGQFHKIPL